MLKQPLVNSTDLETAYLEALGYGGWTWNPVLSHNALASVSQRVYASSIYLVAGKTINNILVGCTTVSTAATLTKTGIYSIGGTLLASSADASATFNAGTGKHAVPLSSSYTVLSTGVYYLAFLNVAATGAALSSSVTGNSVVSAAVGSGPLMAASQNGQVDLPASATFTASGTSYWFGWS